jgi:hypothetical protein
MHRHADTLLRRLAVGLVGLGALASLVQYRWRAATEDLVESLAGADSGAVPLVFDAQEITGLPLPVQRYFRAVLREGQALPTRARLFQVGQFLFRPESCGWRPFTAVEHISCGRDAKTAGFVWDARIMLAPGAAVRVRDAFVHGTGYMQASIMGLFPLASVMGTPEIAAGALHRYLAETVWCPSALLPSHGVVWTPLDENRARAALRAGDVTVSLDFHFGEDGLVQSVFTQERLRDVNGTSVPTPWQGRFSDYHRCGDKLVPRSGEVEWLLPDGPQLYWKGQVTEAVYRFPTAPAENVSAPRNP